MKNLKKLILAAIMTLSLSVPAAASDPVDLVSLQEKGLSPETIGRYLAQNLDSTRIAPQVNADLLSRLGEYGGDELAASYLNLDKQTAHLQRRDFSPEVVEQLLKSDIGAANMKKVLDGEAVKAASAASSAAPVPAPPVAMSAPPTPPQAPVAIAESDLAPPVLSSAREAAAAMAVPPAPVAAIPAPSQPPAGFESTAPPAAKLAPPAMPSLSIAPSAPQVAAPRVAAPVVEAPQAPAQPQRFQNLKPGQAADPGSKMPPPLDTYEIRQPSANSPWMGVTERELADGHRVEVNTMGNPAMVGQEVFNRPSGHKVYRYHSGNTGQPAPMTDPVQERKNREDLQIIFGGSK
ncbi:hypothetical protein C4J81_06110 [Deltaproteobacteria bacterium Smac51]|nr:hypothetical protein C4J81_06110 [Deltaproteobacteria bacterium Smac51]